MVGLSRWRRLQRAALGAAALAGAAWLAACSPGAPAPLELPPWLEPTERWRRQGPAQDIVRLDLAAARHLRSFRALHGKGELRERAVAAGHGPAEVIAAIDQALAAAGRSATRAPASAGLPGEQEVVWAAQRGAPVVLVYLGSRDPARLPDFVLLIEPR